MLGRAEIDLEGHQLAVEHGHDVVQWTHPAGPVIAPAHGFGPGNAQDGGRQQCGQHLARGQARHALDIEPRGVLLRAAALAGIEAGDLAGLQEGFDHLVGGTDPRTLDLVHALRLAGGKPVDPQRQAPGCGEALGAGEGEPLLRQLVADQGLQILGRARLHARGDFLGQKLEQEFGHGFSPPSPPLSPPGRRAKASLRSSPWPRRAPARYRIGARSPR